MGQPETGTQTLTLFGIYVPLTRALPSLALILSA